MKNRTWTVTYRNCISGQRITSAVSAVSLRRAQEKAQSNCPIGDDGIPPFAGIPVGNGRNRKSRLQGKVWEVEHIEPHDETPAQIIIAEFAERQQGGHFACPRCGRMCMNAEGITRNALSRRATVYICDTCGTAEALESLIGCITPLTAWAIAEHPENWRMNKDGGSIHE